MMLLKVFLSFSVTMSLKDVCASLDKIVVEFFNTLDKIYATQHELETVMKDGYFHMAKVR